MSRVQTFKRSLASVMRLWGREDYDKAFSEVEEMLKIWPGNSHLHILRSNLAQLQEDHALSLDDTRQSLLDARELDPSSPAAPFELAHFLDAVDDDPKAAVKAYGDSIAQARKLLIEGLIGQAKALLQLDRTRDLDQCLLELLSVMHFEPDAAENKSPDLAPDVILESSNGRVYAVQLKGPYADQVEEILQERKSYRSA